MLSWPSPGYEVLEARDIFVGVNAVDYSGYPDCRPGYIAAFEHLANPGDQGRRGGSAFSVHAPLIQLNQAQIVAAGSHALGSITASRCPCYQAMTPAARVSATPAACAAGCRRQDSQTRRGTADPMSEPPSSSAWALPAAPPSAPFPSTRFCTAGALADLVAMGDSNRLRMWLLAWPPPLSAPFCSAGPALST